MIGQPANARVCVIVIAWGLSLEFLHGESWVFLSLGYLWERCIFLVRCWFTDFVIQTGSKYPIAHGRKRSNLWTTVWMPNASRSQGFPEESKRTSSPRLASALAHHCCHSGLTGENLLLKIVRPEFKLQSATTWGGNASWSQFDLIALIWTGITA